MTIEELGSIGEIIGSIAVLATLIYLAMEIRLSRHATMALIYQHRSDAASDARAQIGASPSQSLAVYKFNRTMRELGTGTAIESCSETELAQISFYFAAQLNRIDNVHYQYNQGLVDHEFYQATFVEGVREFGEVWEALGLVTENQRSSFIKDVRAVLAERAKAA